MNLNENEQKYFQHGFILGVIFSAIAFIIWALNYLQ